MERDRGGSSHETNHYEAPEHEVIVSSYGHSRLIGPLGSDASAESATGGIRAFNKEIGQSGLEVRIATKRVKPRYVKQGISRSSPPQ